MAKCMKCGGPKMQKGGSTMKTTVGSATPKGQIYGIPNAGATGPNKQGMDSMKKGGSTFGMLSVKAGVDKNPRATAADRIAGVKMSKKKMGDATKKKC